MKNKKNHLSNKEKRNIERQKKLKNERIRKRIQRFAIILVTILIVGGAIQRYIFMQDTGVTIGQIVDKHRDIGRGFRGYAATIVFYVNGVQVHSTIRVPRKSCHVGDCYVLEYSKRKPTMISVLWDKGKQPCPSSKDETPSLNF